MVERTTIHIPRDSGIYRFLNKLKKQNPDKSNWEMLESMIVETPTGNEEMTLNDELKKTHEEMKAKGLSMREKPAYGIEITMSGSGIVILGDPGEIPNYLDLEAPPINFDDDKIRQNLRREIRDLILDFVIRNGEPKIKLNEKEVIQ